MNTDGHRFWGLNSSFASLGFASLSGDRMPAREKRGFEQSLSVFICVYLWLNWIVTAKRQP